MMYTKHAGFLSALGSGIKSIGTGIADVVKAHPVATTAIGMGAAAAAAAPAIAGSLQQHTINQCITAIRQLEQEVSDPEVTQRLEDLISSMQNGSVNVTQVYNILRQGGLV